ncbi:hypothetical protein V8D89_014378 [Ganoderma adspersum]
MHSRWRKERQRLALRAPAMPSASTSSMPNDTELLVLHPPSSLTECVPANISWTGGMPPYSLQINLGAPGEMVQQFDDIFATNFVWSTDVAAGTQVSFQIVDEQTNVLRLESMSVIVVGAGPDTACVYNPGYLPPTSSAVSATPTLSSPTISSTGMSTSPSVSWSAASASPLKIVASATPSIALPSSFPATQTAQRVSPSGATTAFIVLGLLTLPLLLIWLWWRFRVNRRRKDGDDPEKQEVTCEGHKFEAGAHWTDDESTETSDDQVNKVLDETLSAPSMDQDLIPTATPGPLPERQTPTDSTPASDIEPFTPRFSSRQTTGKGVAQRRRLSSVQSDAGTLSDTGAARLSISTSSTLPPSYRTRRSSVYMPVMPRSPALPLPPFPPPAYTPANLKPPPRAFRPLRRARGYRITTASKLGQGQARDNVSTSAGVESPREPDGTRSDATRVEDRDHGTEEMLTRGPPFSDSKGGPSNEPGSLSRVSSADAQDSVREAGATIISTDRET